MSLTCPHCQADRKNIVLDVSVVLPFQVNDEGNLELDIPVNEIASQAQECSHDDISGYCRVCEKTFPFKWELLKK